MRWKIVEDLINFDLCDVKKCFLRQTTLTQTRNSSDQDEYRLIKPSKKCGRAEEENPVTVERFTSGSFVGMIEMKGG